MATLFLHGDLHPFDQKVLMEAFKTGSDYDSACAAARMAADLMDIRIWFGGRVPNKEVHMYAVKLRPGKPKDVQVIVEDMKI